MNIHPDVLAAHAEFGGDLESMQKLYEYPDLKAEVESLRSSVSQPPANPRGTPMTDAAEKNDKTPAPPNKLYRHKKRGTFYEVIGVGKMQSECWYEDNAGWTAVDMREVTIYRSVDDETIWVRPTEEFNDGRFEPFGLSP